MLLSALLLLKFIIFTNLIKIEHNRIPIIIVSTLISLVILSLIYGSKLKHKKTIAMSFYIIISLLMLGDAGYYAYFNQLPSLIVLKQTNQLAAVTDSIKAILDLKKLALILDIPFIIFLSKKIKNEFLEENNYKKWVPITSILLLISILGAYGINHKLQSITSQEIYMYHALDIKNTLLGEKNKSQASAALTLEDLEDLKDRTKLKDGKLTGLGKDKNLIVLQVEALQNFVINLNYNGQEITPNLNKLVGHMSSVYYDNYYQLLGRGNTSDAEFVSHNSFHPSMEEPSYTQYADNTFYGLPWLLRDNGYHAWAFHGYGKTFWNREKAYVSQGFERFLSEEDYKFDDPIGFGIKDEDFFDQSLNYIKELDQIDDNPFYAFLITLTSHTPFVMPEEHQVLKIKEEHKNTMLGDYLQSIHYADKEIGRFIEGLKKEGLYDNTVLTIYGDHFAVPSVNENDQKIMTDLLGEEYDYDTMMNTPLIIHIPNEEINETISTIGSQIDYYPTLMNIMGYENTKGLVFGRDLTNYKGYNYVSPQTYMQKGSFMDDEVIFTIARDGIFEHSKATSIKTREPLDIQEFRPMYDKVISEINKSNYILKQNLLKEYIENNGEVNLTAHSGLDIENKDFITIAHFNSLEELNENYLKGYRLISADLQWTRDENIILLKDWYWYYNNLFENPVGHPTLEEFKSMKMKDGQTQMTFEDLLKWMEDHPDVYIVLRTTEARDSIFVKIKDEYNDKLDRFIPEIKHFQHYFTTTYQGFRNILLNISIQDYSDDEVLDFINMHPQYGIIMDKQRSKTSLSKELKNTGLEVYVEKPVNRFKRLLNNNPTNLYNRIK